MKKLIYSVILLLATYNYAGAQQRQLEKILQESGVSGIQLAHVEDGKEKVYIAGVIRDGSKQPINSETVFHAASLSKSVFAYIFFRLYDRGLIGLDEPLIKYNGNYANYSKFNDPKVDLITARMVLRHTTGMPNWGDDNNYHMVFTPDSCFNYSGDGFLFLQKAMEKVTGKPLNQLAIEEAFEPLQMRNSSYVWDERFTGRVGFDPTNQKDRRYVDLEANAAYSLSTTAHDFSLFLQAILEGKGLKPDTRAMIFEKASPANRYGTPENSADPHIDWGLGMGLQQNEKGLAAWQWGDGYGGNYKCFYLAFPATKESLVFFTHSNKGLDITPDIVNLFLGKQTTWAIKWLGYGYQYPETMKKFKKQLLKKGYTQVIPLVERNKKQDATFLISENDLNSYGYELLEKGKKEEALEIFKLNVYLFPQSSNTYDSLGETYEAMGQKEPAISNYKKVLELNPKSANAVKHLKQLESHP